MSEQSGNVDSNNGETEVTLNAETVEAGKQQPDTADNVTASTTDTPVAKAEPKAKAPPKAKAVPKSKTASKVKAAPKTKAGPKVKAPPKAKTAANPKSKAKTAAKSKPARATAKGKNAAASSGASGVIARGVALMAPSLALAKVASTWVTAQTADAGSWVSSNARKATDTPLAKKIADSRISHGAAEQLTRAKVTVKASKPYAALSEWTVVKKVASRFSSK